MLVFRYVLNLLVVFCKYPYILSLPTTTTITTHIGNSGCFEKYGLSQLSNTDNICDCFGRYFLLQEGYRKANSEEALVSDTNRFSDCKFLLRYT